MSEKKPISLQSLIELKASVEHSLNKSGERVFIDPVYRFRFRHGSDYEQIRTITAEQLEAIITPADLLAIIEKRVAEIQDGTQIQHGGQDGLDTD